MSGYSGGGGITFFESAQQAITQAGTLTIAHGLGAIPKTCQALIVCKTIQFNYSVGDVVVIDPSVHSTTQGLSIVVDATNITIRYGNSGTPLHITDKTTGNGGDITPANWKLILKAFV